MPEQCVCAKPCASLQQQHGVVLLFSLVAIVVALAAPDYSDLTDSRQTAH